MINNNNNNGPNGHLFYVGGDLMMRRGMLPIIMLPDGDLRIVLHLVPFWIFTIWGSVHIKYRHYAKTMPWGVFNTMMAILLRYVSFETVMIGIPHLTTPESHGVYFVFFRKMTVIWIGSTAADINSSPSSSVSSINLSGADLNPADINFTRIFLIIKTLNWFCYSVFKIALHGVWRLCLKNVGYHCFESGVGFLNQFSPFSHFLHFSELSKQLLAIAYNVHIWQVSVLRGYLTNMNKGSFTKLIFSPTEKLTNGALISTPHPRTICPVRSYYLSRYWSIMKAPQKGAFFYDLIHKLLGDAVAVWN